MTDVAALIADMVRSGVDPDLIGRTAAALAEASAIPQASARQLRNARYYDAHADDIKAKASEKRLKASERLNGESAHIEHARTHVEDNLKPIDSLENKKAAGRGANRLEAVRAELATVLDAEHVEAIIEHRKNKRAPLTAHAAKLLAKQFASCPEPNAAADTMIANGWQGFNRDWLNGRTNGHHDPPPSQAEVVKFRTVEEVMAERIAQRAAGN